jgi:hypothetical protein
MSESELPERASLANALEEEEARLRRLETERADAKVRADALRSRLAALDEAPMVRRDTVTALATAPPSPAEKVLLFRQLFRGRDDVYPTRFVRKKTGEPGYAPACSNKFVDGVCQLPKVKCGDCTNQAFRRVDDSAVLGHLRGKHVMAVYPMLPDETCWLLAVDFDKSTWKEDVRAFAETARRLDLPVLVERSRVHAGCWPFALGGSNTSAGTPGSAAGQTWDHFRRRPTA